MFCPNCATKQIDGAHFCRSCGANISLVPQAMTGQLPQANPPDEGYYRRRRRDRGASSGYAIRSIMTGTMFAVIAVMTSRYVEGGSRWWFWLLIPAFMMFARGLSVFARSGGRKNETVKPLQPMVNALRTPELPVPRTGELMTPVPSVTEGTTRHLGAEARTRPFDLSDANKHF